MYITDVSNFDFDNYKLLKILTEILGVGIKEVEGKNKEEILQIIKSKK
jgi:hypothetical protein